MAETRKITFEFVDEKDIRHRSRTHNWEKHLEEELVPFLVENLKTRETVILSEKSVREIFDATEKSTKFPSLYAHILKLFKSRDMVVEKGTHRDGGNVFIFRHRIATRDKAKVDNE